MTAIQRLPATARTWGGSAENAWEPTANPYVDTALLDLPDTAIPIIKEIWKPRSSWAGFASRVRDQPKTLRSVVEGAARSNGSEKRVPSSVLLELPESVFAYDRRTGGHLQAAMARELAKLHQEDLGDMMPKGAQARYQVTAAADLPANKMRVRLGPAIYVPETNEQPAWRVDLSLDGADWDSLPPLVIHEHQQLFIFSGSVNLGSQVCADWPFAHHAGLVIENRPGQPSLDFSAEPLNCLETLHNLQAGWTVVREPGAGADNACLYLKTTRLHRASTPVVEKELVPAPQPAQPHRSEKTDLAKTEPVLNDLQQVDPPISSVDDAPTRLQGGRVDPGMDDAPTRLQCANAPRRAARMALRGLAVQRLSLYASGGVQGLQWALDARGQLVRSDAPNALHRFELAPNDELRLLNRSGQRVMALGESLPLQAGRALSVWGPLPDALASGYLGWLSLPDCPSAPLVQGEELTVGRMHPALTALRPLAQAGKVLAQPADGADRLGLSRHHASLCLSPEGLLVKTLGEASAAHLDADMGFVGWITPGKPAVLENGEHLLLAHYVWRLEGAGDAKLFER